MKEKVLLGMSGGVDSSVSAILLKNAGYEVIGCTMKLLESSESTIEDAKKVCEKLGIPHHVVDYTEEFSCKVINNFMEEYKKAKTPNPCIQCNQYIKFGKLYEKAKELGCKYVATGHYAKIEYSKKYNQHVLKKAQEEKKDQTYFLYTISPEKIENIIFPLQEYTDKEEIRKIAEDNNLQVARKKDSQEICFIPNNNYQEFLIKNSKTNFKSGNIILRTGEILGKHKGIINYTIGQRKGIGVSYKEPLYVLELNYKTNQVIVGKEEELYSNKLTATNMKWTVKSIEERINNKENIECYAKIRYRAKEAKAVISLEGKDIINVNFAEPQRAITSGQAVVFYDSEGIVLGGGTILCN